MHYKSNLGRESQYRSEPGDISLSTPVSRTGVIRDRCPDLLLAIRHIGFQVYSASRPTDSRISSEKYLELSLGLRSVGKVLHAVNHM